MFYYSTVSIQIYSVQLIYCFYDNDDELKGNAQFVQKVTFEPLMNFKLDHFGSWKCYKSYYF